jgi:hypothetical protein
MMKKTYLLTYLLTIIFISSCNDPYLEDNTILDNMIINQNVILKEGLLNISSKDAFLSLYEDIKLQGAESFYYKKIKNLQNSDFKTLRPYFNEAESSEFELFLINSVWS